MESRPLGVLDHNIIHIRENKKQKGRDEFPSHLVIGIISREKMPYRIYDKEEHAEFKKNGKYLEDSIDKLRYIAFNIFLK